ncbi:MAG: hypothetical protein ACYSR8_10870 [Planctomycetota bacterium]|jgi:probable HAF family extracellular repeat protein
METKIRAVALFLVLFGTVRATSVEYAIRDLGTLESDPESKAFGINDYGQVVGYSGNVQGPEAGRRAFLWDNGTMLNLGTLGGNHSEAYAINNHSQVVGRSNLSSAEWDVRGFVWENGLMIDLGTLQGGWTEAHGINNLAQVVGYTGADAFILENGSMSSLSNGSPTDYGRAYAINNAGQIVGFSSGSGGVATACLWENGSVTALGTLGGSTSYAWDISAYGQIVGSSTIAGIPPYTRAFLWENGSMTDLGPQPAGWSEAYAINDGGQIVGQSGKRAVLWEDGTLIDLNEFLSAGSEWLLLYEARGINNSGQVVGTGMVSSGDYHAFLMTPVIYTEIDIQPKTLNLRSKGKWISCEIRLGEDYNVADIDPYSVFLEDEIQAEWLWFNEQQQVAMAKFSRSALQELLTDLETPTTVELLVSGELNDGTIFEGTDTIKLIKKNPRSKQLRSGKLTSLRKP